MRTLPIASLAVAATLAVAAGCGGGGKKEAPVTTTSSSLEEETTTSLATTTSTTIDPALRDLLLVAEDLPGFKAATTPPEEGEPFFKACDPAETPAFKVLYDAPSADGATFVRGKDDAVEVSSSVGRLPAEQAEAGLTELLDQKALTCLQKDLQALADKDLPSGVTATAKVTSSKATITGIDQTVLLSGTTTVTGGPASQSVRQDLVFLRSSGTVLVVSYAGLTTLATPTERQKIVAIAARKLAAAAGGTTSTTEDTSGSSSTSSTRKTSTTRRSTTTTRSGSTTSTTRKATTTSSTV